MTKTVAHNRPLEELFNSLTHGVGFLLSILGLILLVSAAAEQGDAMKVVCFSIYGASLILLYGASTLFHSFWGRPVERKLQVFDHAAIYILIAGTYTPFALITLQGGWGWSIFGVIWGLAILGVGFKIRYGDRFKKLSNAFYLFMGWLIIIAIFPMLERLPSGGWFWLIGGGLSYTVGVVFYVWHKLPFNHAIWHIFVMGGSLAHFLGIYYYLLPGA